MNESEMSELEIALARGYVENVDVTSTLMEEFSSVDREGWPEFDASVEGTNDHNEVLHPEEF